MGASTIGTKFGAYCPPGFKPMCVVKQGSVGPKAIGVGSKRTREGKAAPMQSGGHNRSTKGYQAAKVKR